MTTALRQARQLFRRHGGILRTGEAVTAGIHPRTLYAMRESGEVEMLARGVYRLASMPPLADPDLATVAKRVPNAVACLISALSLHELTTQVPHEVHIAIRRSVGSPVLTYPPLRVYRFSDAAFEAGIETRKIADVSLRVYSAEKTLADCFKYRNRIGLDVALEALRVYRNRRKKNFQKVLEFARVCRVERVIRPYLEASV
ncbi:MAG: type IV toxin-antitoxin system AbiEi family antitoxin domain-containing protein [Phycisphaerae bacterium]|nr:type IV toxin-antitoxin system AbiEi family antitoxin domain-containing protein [Phycisphaerae bacterium]